MSGHAANVDFSDLAVVRLFAGPYDGACLAMPRDLDVAQALVRTTEEPWVHLYVNPNFKPPVGESEVSSLNFVLPKNAKLRTVVPKNIPSVEFVFATWLSQDDVDSVIEES